MSNAGWLVLLFTMFAIVVVFVLVKEFNIYRAVQSQESFFASWNPYKMNYNPWISNIMNNSSQPTTTQATRSFSASLSGIQGTAAEVSEIKTKMKQINKELGFDVSDDQLFEFKDYIIKNKDNIMGTKDVDRGWQYAGNFQDKDPNDRGHRGSRAFPNKTWGRVNSVQECKNRAGNLGHTVIGLQDGGECWTGNDLNQAKRNGAYVWGYTGEMGSQWNNQVYYKQTDKVTTLDENSYKTIIQQLTDDNLKSYKAVVASTNLSRAIQPMTTMTNQEEANDAAMKSINATLGFTVEDGMFDEFKQYLKDAGHIKGVDISDNWVRQGLYNARQDISGSGIATLNAPPVGERQGYYIFGVKECQEIAASKDHTVIGIQSAGSMCFSGNDLTKATQYGEVKDVSYDAPLGAYLKNQLYYRKVSSKNNFSKESYNTFITSLLNIGINTYGKLRRWVKANPGKSLVPGAKPQKLTEVIPYLRTYGSEFANKNRFFIDVGEKESFTQPGFAAMFKRFQRQYQDYNENLTKYLDELPLYLQAETGSRECTDINATCMEYSKKFIKKLSEHELTTPDDIKVVRGILSNIGLRPEMDIITVLNKMKSFGVRSPQIRTEGFLAPYKKFGFNSNTGLLLTIDALKDMKISEDTSRTNKVGFRQFVNVSPFGVNIDNMDTFNRYLRRINYTLDSNNFSQFLNAVLKFDNTYKEPIMETLQHFSNSLADKYKMTIDNYWVLESHLYEDPAVNGYARPKNTNMTCDISELMTAFKIHHNSLAYPNIPIPDKTTFMAAWAPFNKLLLVDRQININDSDICAFIGKLAIPYYDVPGTDITGHTIPIFTGPEPFLGRYSREGAQTISGDREVQLLGISEWIVKMGINPQAFSIDGTTQITFSAFQSFMKTNIGITNGTQEQQFLTFVRTINVPAAEVKSFVELLNKFGASYVTGTFDQFKQNCYNVGISSYAQIEPFISTLVRYGVKADNMTNFIQKCSEFGVNFAVYKEGFFIMIRLFELYEISFVRNDYDHNSTYFETFVNNMIAENINNDCIDTIISPLLKTLNDGVEPQPANPPKQSVSGITEIRRKLRDILVQRKDVFPNESSLSNVPYFRSLDKKGNEVDQFVGSEIPELIRTTNGNTISARIIDSRLFYRYIICGNTINSPPPIYLNYPFICSVLTANEFSYIACGKGGQVLDQQSVMSRLLKITLRKLASHRNAIETEYKYYNELIITANLIRTIPTKLFYEMCNYIADNIDALRIYNNPDYRANTEYADIVPAKPVADAISCDSLAKPYSGTTNYSPAEPVQLNYDLLTSDKIAVIATGTSGEVKGELRAAAK